ncbi:MAG: ImmA/IrrE family metallo-endopeptidase [Actinomycetes bacterium]
MSRPRSFADPAGGPVVDQDRHGTDMAAMEDAAVAVLDGLPDWIWDCQPPVPVERIAEDRFGLRVIDTPDPSTVAGAPDPGENAHLSGLLLPARGEIWVHSGEAQRWPPRRRFTIAHELGHWILHRDAGHPVMCRAAELAGGRVITGALPDIAPADKPKERPPLPIEEAEANAFAAALLLPAVQIRAEHATCGGSIGRLMEIFESSNAALERRLRTLGLSWSD